MKLPIDELLPQALLSLEQNPNLIIEASPGSGKTTRVPPALLKAKFFSSPQQILVLEPRRLAAKQSARRIAEEMHSRVGEQVGYQFRYENETSPQTQIKFLTEGMFLRLLPHNPHLSGIAAVILDEFHERHLQSDLALGYLKWLQETQRPDLRIILMSATLDSNSLSSYLGNAPILKLQTQLHPIQIHHLQAPPQKPLESLVQDHVQRALRETSGDILVFLPGRAEILRCKESLSGLTSVHVCTLWGELSKEEQDQALTPLAQRKVILSTNIAETSLTIPAVTAVIDSGLHRRASYSWWSGIPALKTRPISRASALQRTGRAGRTQAGVCYRLYTQADFATRPPYETPEIIRSDLSQSLLELQSSGVKISQFPWYEAPPQGSIKASLDLLERLGAIQGEEPELTELGRTMVKVPTHPRISRFLVEARAQGLLEQGSWIAAALADGRIEAGNLFDHLHRYTEDEHLRRTRTLLLKELSQNSTSRSQMPSPWSAGSGLAYSVLMGFSDRVAQARKSSPQTQRIQSHEVELIFATGGSALVKDTGEWREGHFMVLIDLQESQGQNQKRPHYNVRSWVPIQEDWLLEVKPQGVQEIERCVWDQKKQRCIQVSQLIYGELILSEQMTSPKDFREALEVLLKNTLKLALDSATPEDWLRALSPILDSSETQALESSLTRARLFQKHTKLPEVHFWNHLRPYLEGMSSLSELQNQNWSILFLEAMLSERAAQLNQLLPTHIQLSSGRRLPIHYSLTQEPWIQSRLQDFIGMNQTPVLLQGKLKVLVHLLAPNHRPVQVTSDLASFWKNHYPQLRPSLSRRYPKHAWPEI